MEEKIQKLLVFGMKKNMDVSYTMVKEEGNYIRYSVDPYPMIELNIGDPSEECFGIKLDIALQELQNILN